MPSRSRWGWSRAQAPAPRRVILRRRTWPESTVIVGLSGAASWRDTNAPTRHRRCQLHVSGIPRAGFDRPRPDPGLQVRVPAEDPAQAQAPRPLAQAARPSAQVARPWDLGARWAVIPRE